MKFSALVLAAALAQFAAAAGENDACISKCIMEATTSTSNAPPLLQDCTPRDAQNERTSEIDLCFSSWIVHNMTEECVTADCKDALPELQTCNHTYTPDPRLVENSAPDVARTGSLLAASGVAFTLALQYL
ncbi:hypothetical protein AURDEDRAFT_156137 [Auricularia subglabra TFB-10046 SS5]|nr:hypothetical protein AURDEDRAFT_156137 [Auricularia subglabra TFB-10046 SS5]